MTSLQLVWSASCPVRNLSTPRVGISASCPVIRPMQVRLILYSYTNIDISQFFILKKNTITMAMFTNCRVDIRRFLFSTLGQSAPGTVFLQVMKISAALLVLTLFKEDRFVELLLVYYHHHPPQPFYGPFSGTNRVSRCQKRTSGL